MRTSFRLLVISLALAGMIPAGPPAFAGNDDWARDLNDGLLAPWMYGGERRHARNERGRERDTWCRNRARDHSRTLDGIYRTERELDRKRRHGEDVRGARDDIERQIDAVHDDPEYDERCR